MDPELPAENDESSQSQLIGSSKNAGAATVALDGNQTSKDADGEQSDANVQAAAANLVRLITGESAHNTLIIRNLETADKSDDFSDDDDRRDVDDLQAQLGRIRTTLNLSEKETDRLSTAILTLRSLWSQPQNAQIGKTYGSGLLTPSELARFEFPLTPLLRDAKHDDHVEFNGAWEGAWTNWSVVYYRHGKSSGLKNWDISELKSVTDNFKYCADWFTPSARHTDWDRYYDMKDFLSQACGWIAYQRTLWKLAKEKVLPNVKEISDEEWTEVLQNFSLFLWFDFYVMNMDFMNSYDYQTVEPSVYTYVVYF